jgi:hypothetical protein
MKLAPPYNKVESIEDQCRNNAKPDDFCGLVVDLQKGTDHGKNARQLSTTWGSTWYNVIFCQTLYPRHPALSYVGTHRPNFDTFSSQHRSFDPLALVCWKNFSLAFVGVVSSLTFVGAKAKQTNGLTTTTRRLD